MHMPETVAEARLSPCLAERSASPILRTGPLASSAVDARYLSPRHDLPKPTDELTEEQCP